MDYLLGVYGFQYDAAMRRTGYRKCPRSEGILRADFGGNATTPGFVEGLL
jgi:hypothetical protein